MVTAAFLDREGKKYEGDDIEELGDDLARAGELAEVGEVIGYMEPGGDGHHAATTDARANPAQHDDETAAAVQKQAAKSIGTSVKSSLVKPAPADPEPSKPSTRICSVAANRHKKKHVA